MINQIETITVHGEKTIDLGIKLIVIIANGLAYILLDASTGLDLIDKGGVIAVLLLVTYTLWKMVQAKDKAIKKSYDERLKDKDDRIKELKKELDKK